MKYIRFTYVDVKTQIPVTKEPAKNGPDIPQGLTPTFAIESSYGNSPILYGIAEDTLELEDWMVEITEEDFFSIFKQELKDRVAVKRKVVEQGGIVVDNTFVRTDIASQNRVSNLITSLTLDTGMLQVDFESNPGDWVVLTRDEAFTIGKAVNQHVQSCFTWAKQMHEQIDAMTTFDDALVVVTSITSFGTLV